MNYFIHLIKSDQTVIYNKITNPDTGDCCYPDILFDHNFTESQIEDADLYEKTSSAIREFGSSKVLIASYSEDSDAVFLRERMELLHSTSKVSSFNNELYEKMCDNLMLSASMRHNFYQLMQYYTETGRDMEDLLIPFTEEYAFPVGNKNEGKKIYEIIRNSVLC